MKTHPLYQAAIQMASGEVTPAGIDFFLGQTIDRFTDASGRALPELQSVLEAIETDFIEGKTTAVVAAFQRLVAQVGGKVRGAIVLPQDDVPYWTLHLETPADDQLKRKLLRGQSTKEVAQQFPFAEFHSTPELSAEADIVIIGAGLTGTNVAYHLNREAPQGTRIVILDSDLLKAASFRNGGNFEPVPENFLGDYEGLARERQKYIQLTRPHLSENQALELAKEQSNWILKWCASNVKQLQAMFSENGIHAFALKNGWLRMAETSAEELALKTEVERAQKLGLEFEFWPCDRIRSELKIPAKFGGSMAKNSGNYHPGRLITQLLRLLIQRGVQLHTHTPVQRISNAENGTYRIETERGSINARKVVVGTNAFTRDLLPQMASAIHPFQSHIADFEHVALPSENPIVFATLTWNLGDGYAHFRRETVGRDAQGTQRGMYHVGGGRDLPIEDPHHVTPQPEVLQSIVSNFNSLFPETKGQPPRRFWTGPMGFTPDRIPLVGEYRPGLFLSAGYNGYGGTWSIQAAYETAQLVLHGRGTALYEERFLSPHRFENGTAVNPLGRSFMNDDPEAYRIALRR